MANRMGSARRASKKWMDESYSIENLKSSMKEEDSQSCKEGVECIIIEKNEEKESSLWKRTAWTDMMVKILITALSYISEDARAPVDYSDNGKRKFYHKHMKGKWKAVSKVMVEKGFNVSAQQCEDKFRTVNKTHRQLNNSLSRSNIFDVVANPTLLDSIDYLTDKEKNKVKKILSSKQLFYGEMWSYHSRNRFHLPHDHELQKSMLLALGETKKAPKLMMCQYDHAYFIINDKME